MKQDYNTYTEEDHRVWQILFDRQIENLQDKACSQYLECLSAIRSVLHGHRIPLFEQLDTSLSKETGWSIQVVPGHIPVRDFFHLLAERKFPSSTWLRTLDQLDYLEEPDMFHDIFGHVPLLMHAKYADFMHSIGKLGVIWADNQLAINALRSLYWFTIEFGLLSDKAGRSIYGAGILSSYGESVQVMDAQTTCEQFNIADILKTDFRTDTMQNTYFTANNFDDFLNSLPEVEILLDETVKVKRRSR